MHSRKFTFVNSHHDNATSILAFSCCSFILTPVRAILYCVVIIVTVVCLVVLLAVIMKIIVILISQTDKFKECFQTGNFKNRWLEKILHLHPNVFMNKKQFDIILMISLIMLLIYAHAYSAFIFQININSSNKTLDEITKFIIPKVLLLVIAWFLPKLFLNPDKPWFIWWKYTGNTCVETPV